MLQGHSLLPAPPAVDWPELDVEVLRWHKALADQHQDLFALPGDIEQDNGVPGAARYHDEIAAYTNPKWPWIQAVYKVNIASFHPREHNMQAMEFPRTVSTTGRHILWWSWRGYRQCTDVDVLGDDKPIANKSAEMVGYLASSKVLFERIDHAAYDAG